MAQGNLAHRPQLWVAGDLNAFFGLFTNVLLNVLVLSGLALYVAQIPALHFPSEISSMPGLPGN